VHDGATTEVNFEASRTSLVVRGHVTAGGLPLAGFSVQVQSLDTGEQGRESPSTNEQGNFELRVTAPGRYSFFVSKDGSRAVAEALVEDRTPCDIDLDLPGGTIAGVVRNTKGLPVSNAAVTILRAADPGTDEQATLVDRLRLTDTDGRGRFEFQLLAPGTYALRTPDKVFAREADKRIPFGRVVVPEIHVNNGPTTSLVIQLRPEGFIRGRVTDSQGNGLGNARVRVFDPAGVSLSATWSVRTDETGDFGIDSLAPGTYMIGARVGDALGQRVHVEVEEGKTTQAAVLFP
jgi:protocatechuate 3,4-dioxygenase beta subunit